MTDPDGMQLLALTILFGEEILFSAAPPLGQTIPSRTLEFAGSTLVLRCSIKNMQLRRLFPALNTFWGLAVSVTSSSTEQSIGLALNSAFYGIKLNTLIDWEVTDRVGRATFFGREHWALANLLDNISLPNLMTNLVTVSYSKTAFEGKSVSILCILATPDH